MSRLNEYRDIAQKMIMAGVKAADPANAISESVILDGKKISIKGNEFDLNNYDKVYMFGIGKASSSMAHALEGIITPDDGLVITKKGEEIGDVEVKTIPVYKAYHPEPKEENIKYSNRIMEMIENINEDDSPLILFLVSGGGSALFCAPPAGITIDEMYKLNQLLMKCGANIYEINTIRKHLSRVKGGRFGQICSEKGATVVSLILSDVVGDDMSVIASGPTYKDDTTFKEAIEITEDYGIWDELPQSIKNHLEKGLENEAMESPDQIPENIYNYLISNNMIALSAAEEIAGEAGFNTMILTSQNSGEAKEIAKCVMGIAREIQDSGNPIDVPAAIIMGGEMVVTFDWKDRDGFGPNREFVLSSALEIINRNNIVVAGADTDGVDGEGKSGAIADTDTVSRAEKDAKYYLDTHDAELFFDSLGDSLEFSSHTNVNDIDVVIIGPK
ncbi:MAG: glycerate kinase type-2 family protein [Halanaerobiaceae bacterium]